MPDDHSLSDHSFSVTKRAHEVLNKYTQTHTALGKNNLTAPFKTMKDMFMTAVYLGSSNGRPRPLESPKESPFKGQVLNHDEQLYLQALAIGHTENAEVIGDPQQVVRIAEEYANAGILQLQEILESGGEDALWNLVNFFTEKDDEQESDEPTS